MKILSPLLIIIFFSFCQRKQKVEIDNANDLMGDFAIISEVSKGQINCDSIIYKLPQKTENIFHDMIKYKNVSFCSLVANSTDNQFSFSYSQHQPTSTDSILLTKTNRYLNIKGQYYPLLDDDSFADIPRTHQLDHLKSCFITVDEKGNLITGFDYIGNDTVNIPKIEIVCSDSMIYTLPEYTTRYISSEIRRRNHQIDCCYFSRGLDFVYTFVFPYSEMTIFSDKDSILITKTNKYLKIDGKFYNIVTDADNLFSDVGTKRFTPKDSTYFKVNMDGHGTVIK